MVQSTVGQSIANAFGSLGTMSKNIQANRLNDQAYQDNQYKLDRRGEKDLFAKIEAQGDYRIDDAGGSINTYDFYKIAQERPDLAAEVLNIDPRFNVAIDENNNRIQTKVSGFEFQEDGSVIVTVTRPDGRKVPVTEKRTAQNNDVVVNLSADEFQKFGQQVIRDIGATGAAGNDMTFVRDANRLYAARVKDATLNNVVESPIYQDPGASTQVAKIVTVAEPEEREEIAKDMGVDVQVVENSVIEELEATGQYSPEIIKKAKTDGIRSLTEFTLETGKRGRIKNKSDSALKKKVEELEELEAQIVRTEKVRKELDERRAAKGQEPFVWKPEIDGLPATKKRAQELRAELGIPEPEPQTTSAEEPAKEPAPETQTKPNEMETDGSGVASQTTDPKGVATAIKDPKVEPTQEDVTAASKVLSQYQVNTKEDLIKLPSKELHQIAFLMASRQGGTVKDKLEVAQKIINYGMSGDMDYSGVDLFKLGQDQNKFALDQAEFVEQLRQNALDKGDDWNDAYEEAGELLFEIKNNAYDEDMEALEPTNEQAQRVSKMWTRASTYVGVKRKAYQDFALEAAMVYMQQKFDHSSPSWLAWSDMIANIWNKDSSPRIGANSMASLLRATPDPKNPNRAIEFFFRDPNGGKINFPMSPERFKQEFGDNVLADMEKLALQNTRTEVRENAKKRQSGSS